MNNEYPMNLLDEVARVLHEEEWELSPPSDFDASLAYVLATLPERNAVCMMKYFQNGKTYREIGKELGISCERVRQLIAKTIHQLAYPTRRRFLEIGVQGVIEEKAHAARENAVEYRIDEAVKSLAGIAERIRRVSDGEALSVLAEYSDERLDKKKLMPLESLDLSVRTLNCLTRAGKNTVGDVLETSNYDLMRVRNLGKKSFDEIKDKIHSMGLLFCDERGD